MHEMEPISAYWCIEKGASMYTICDLSQVVYYETPQKSMHPYDYIHVMDIHTHNLRMQEKQVVWNFNIHG